jgi:lipopolysaccharide/colanic/teichoic acid biosynthesis glycosyltransferase
MQPVSDTTESLGPVSDYARLKALLDYVAAALLLVPATPLMLLSALLVRLTSRGPAFYSQVRAGLDGKPYRIHKIRSMYHDCEKHTGARWATVGDPRVTPFGRFLRATHLDELPQLWNVLRGEMSLIGPRPERPEFVVPLEKVIEGYRQRLAVRPGVTGLAQVQLPPDTDVESVRRKVAYDLYYIANIGFWLDVRIVAATGLKVFGLPFEALRRLLWLPEEWEILGQEPEGPETLLGGLQPA